MTNKQNYLLNKILFILFIGLVIGCSSETVMNIEATAQSEKKFISAQATAQREKNIIAEATAQREKFISADATVTARIKKYENITPTPKPFPTPTPTNYEKEIREKKVIEEAKKRATERNSKIQRPTATPQNNLVNPTPTPVKVKKEIPKNKLNSFIKYEETLDTYNLFMKFVGLEALNPLVDYSKVNTYCANRIGNDWGKGNRDNRFEPLLEDIKFESKKDCERYISVRRFKVLDMDVWRDNFIGTYLEEKLFNFRGYPACSTATDCWLDKDIYTPEKPKGYDEWDSAKYK